MFADQQSYSKELPNQLSVMSSHTQAPEFDAGNSAQLKTIFQQVLATSDLPRVSDNRMLATLNSKK